MDRRRFLCNSMSAGAGIFGSLSSKQALRTGTDVSNDDMILEKVERAMLSTQRAAWEQGVAMQAMLESGDEEMVILMAKEAVLRQSTDGRLAMLGEEFALTDAASPGEAVLWAAKRTGDPLLMAGFNKLLSYILHDAPRTADGIIYHFSNIPQIWSDSNYMLPPFLAVAGEYREALKQLEGVRKVLWNPGKKLFSHMWDQQKQELVRADFWGVGNGWSAAGMTRLINALPHSMESDREKLTGYVKELLDGCLSHQRQDGLFHNVIDKPESFVETNLAQMLAYTIYRGIAGGWLGSTYKEHADRMRSAAHGKVDNLGLVQGVCGSPEFDHAGTATEGQAFFILMEAAYRDLEKS